MNVHVHIHVGSLGSDESGDIESIVTRAVSAAISAAIAAPRINRAERDADPSRRDGKRDTDEQRDMSRDDAVKALSPLAQTINIDKQTQWAEPLIFSEDDSGERAEGFEPNNHEVSRMPSRDAERRERDAVRQRALRRRRAVGCGKSTCAGCENPCVTVTPTRRGLRDPRRLGEAVDASWPDRSEFNRGFSVDEIIAAWRGTLTFAGITHPVDLAGRVRECKANPSAWTMMLLDKLFVCDESGSRPGGDPVAMTMAGWRKNNHTPSQAARQIFDDVMAKYMLAKATDDRPFVYTIQALISDMQRRKSKSS